MKYILSQDGEPGIFYGRYEEYLKTIRNLLPSHIYQFASDEKYFTLNSPHSLHDSWMNSIEVNERRSEESDPIVEITLKLLGQMHDRIIVLNYEGVIEYTIKGTRAVEDRSEFRYADTFHGDVFTHEIRLSEAGNLIHEIACVTQSSLLIECANFTYREDLLQEGNGLRK